MGGLTTSYEFTLPRGYVDHTGETHRTGTMRLATARDELAPLRDPTIAGPDDPRLTILVLTRVIESLGTVPIINEVVIEGLFAVDLAYLQDFYGVINFGTQEEYDELVRAQRESALVGSGRRPQPTAEAPQEAAPAPGIADSADSADSAASADGADIDEDGVPGGFDEPEGTRAMRRGAVEELPRRAL
jgi:hypothetical protein